MSSACGRVIRLPAPVVTSTVSGTPVKQVEPARTVDKKELPVGVKPRDVKAIIETKTGGRVVVTDDAVYIDEKAESEGIQIKQVKKSWAWLWWILGITGLLFLVDKILNRFLGFNPLRWVVDVLRGLWNKARDWLK